MKIIEHLRSSYLQEFPVAYRAIVIPIKQRNEPTDLVVRHRKARPLESGHDLVVGDVIVVVSVKHFEHIVHAQSPHLDVLEKQVEQVLGTNGNVD